MASSISPPPGLPPTPGPTAVSVEFVARTALLMSLVALSIDTMLPALPAIAADLAAPDATDAELQRSGPLVLSVLFIGLGLGQIAAGPLSDRFGRRPVMFGGLAIFIFGSVLSMLSQNEATMLVGRALQGLGAAGPRIVVTALVRDTYEGDRMARVNSLVMTLFILVPMVAPAIGQGVLLVADWRAIFGLFATVAASAALWFGLRQPETLPPSRRRSLSPANILHAAREVLGTRKSLWHTLATGCVFASFISFLNTAQPILAEQYGLGTRFPLFFALLAGAIGCAALTNARLVERLGAAHLTRLAQWGVVFASLMFVPIVMTHDGHPPLWMLFAWQLPTFFFTGVLMANLSALAMAPLGHLAGMGATITNSLPTLIAVPIGTAIAYTYDGTVLPMVLGFLVLGALARLASHIAESGATPKPPA